MGNLIVDFLLFFFSTVIFIALLYPLGLSLVYNDWMTVLFIFSSFGFALITLTYLASFPFKDANSAFITIGILNFIVGIVLLLLYYIFKVPADYYYTSIIYVLLVYPFWPFAHSMLYCIEY